MEFKRCYGCMRELDVPGAVCPKCGFDNVNDLAGQPNHALTCGTVLGGRYVLGRVLGQGGFGISYIGWNLTMEIPVCLKEYFPDGAAMRSATQSRLVFWGASENAQNLKQSRESFVKEARKAVKLRDLNHVVKVWDVFYENETAYIVMDYIEGETLKDKLLRTQKPLGEKECVELLTPVMQDLEKAHARGIIHRDIKPENIMLDAEGEPILLDMGAAKDLAKSAQNGSTLSSALVVSRGFSPREQYREHGNIGPWTDVYAMCATICYCVTGRVPPTPMDREDGETVDLSAFSPAVAQVLEKGLALKIEDRIQSMDELLDALTAALANPNVKPEPPKPAPPKPEPPKPELPKPEPPKPEPSKPKPNRLVPALAVAAVLLIAAGIYYAKSERPEIMVTTPTGTDIGAAETTTPIPTAKPSTGPSSTSTSKPTPEPTPFPGPLPTPKGEPLNTGETASGLSYEVFADCIRIKKYTGKETSPVIPPEIEGKPVTGIGTSAFRDCSTLTGISIPSSVVSIGNYAFSKCSALKEITIPPNVKTIGDEAFLLCDSLTSFTIPAGVTELSGNPAANCAQLTDITVEEGNAHFISVDGVLYSKDMKTLLGYPAGRRETSFTIPTGVTSTGKHAFRGCSALAEIIIPSSVTSLEPYFACDCRALKSITIPDNVLSIGRSAFYRCTALKEITIPPHVASIESYTFYECSALTDITIPPSVTVINGFAFQGCTSLRNITIPSSVTVIEGCAFSKCSSLETFTFPPGITTIEANCLAECSSLKSIRIPTGVTTIEAFAFTKCSSLETITIPASVTDISSFDIFFKCESLTEIHVEADSYAAAFFSRNKHLVID